MAPHAENPKVCSSKTEKKKIQDELLEKLKLDEEREKKKLEKEAKRRAELEKIKSESLVRQAGLLAPLKKEKHPVQSKNAVMKSQPKKINNKKQQSHKSENKNNQASSYESNSSGWNKREPSYSERRFSRGSSSSENSWKRNEWRNCQSNSKYAPVSDSPWDNTDEHFPMLGAEAPVPQVNVWEERKYKQEEIQALQPQNEYDEEAMLQQALVLSVMEATKEEDRKQKLEEEYRLQMAALEHNPEMLQKFDALEEFTVTDKSEHESRNVLKSTEEQNLNESFSRNVAISTFSQRDKTSSAGGARPKLNKIIDSFGGWGLKDTKKEKNSDTLSNFVGDIVNEKPSWKTAKFNSSHDFQRDVSSINAKKPEKVVDRWLKSDAKTEKPVVSDSWTTACNNDVKKSPVSDPWGENQVLYDGKGTFTDIDEDKLNYPNSAANSDISSKEKNDKLLKEESPGDVLDKWLNSEDESAPVSNGWDDDIVPDGKLNDSTAANIQTDSVSYFGSAPSNYAVTKCENSKGSFSNFETVTSVKDDKSNSSKGYHSMDISSKIINTKDISSDVRSIKKQNELSQSNILSEFESTYNYIVGDTGKSKDGPVNAQTLLSNGNSWNDELSNQSTASSTVSQNQNLPKTELAWEETPNKFATVEESRIFSAMASNEEIDTPPILPPKSVPRVPLVNELNQTVKAEMSGDQCTEESPPILPPQPSSEMPSQYLFNPTMFPGVNPMLGLGMDPITMRQMLMLSNPFFASQLLATEQYYRALGMPVDLFSFPTPTVPNVSFPGMVPFPGTSMEQNTLPNTVNAAAHVSHLQNQYQDQSVLMPGNQNSVSTEKHLTKYPPGLDQDVAATSTHGTLENNDDSWYSSVLSSDSAPVIPPPKPPVLNNNQADSKSISESSETSASSFCYNNMNSQQYVSDNPSSGLLGGENHKSLSAIQACMTKTEISGWGDIDIETPDKCKSKINPWNEDDGWGTDNLPPKSVRNSSVYGEKKKVVHRQPSRQPQFSRFQNNRRFN